MRRRWSDVGVAFGAIVVLVVSGALARGAHVPGLEATAFRALNGLPDALYPVVWPLMQYGTFITIPIVAAIGAVLRRSRFAIITLGVGVSVYYFAKAVKLVVDRGRPAAELADVEHLRGIGRFGYGFPSGHAAVSAALATFAIAYLPSPWRRISVALALVVSFARVYVGAHLPLDVVGGAALGVAAAALANVVGGVPREDVDPRPSSDGPTDRLDVARAP